MSSTMLNTQVPISRLYKVGVQICPDWEENTGMQPGGSKEAKASSGGGLRVGPGVQDA